MTNKLVLYDVNCVPVAEDGTPVSPEPYMVRVVVAANSSSEATRKMLNFFKQYDSRTKTVEIISFVKMTTLESALVIV